MPTTPQCRRSTGDGDRARRTTTRTVGAVFAYEWNLRRSSPAFFGTTRTSPGRWAPRRLSRCAGPRAQLSSGRGRGRPADGGDAASRRSHQSRALDERTPPSATSSRNCSPSSTSRQSDPRAFEAGPGGGRPSSRRRSRRHRPCRRLVCPTLREPEDGRGRVGFARLEGHAREAGLVGESDSARLEAEGAA